MRAEFVSSPASLRSFFSVYILEAVLDMRLSAHLNFLIAQSLD